MSKKWKTIEQLRKEHIKAIKNKTVLTVQQAKFDIFNNGMKNKDKYPKGVWSAIAYIITESYKTRQGK